MSASVPAILCEQLSKTYSGWKPPARRLLEALRDGWLGRGRAEWAQAKDEAEWIRALRPLDLSINAGESVGIIGRNGSGKSTLLQLICGVLRPSGGQVIKRGRVAALLELGSGFDPEFTGRENVHFAASLLGYSDAEIRAAYPEIERFAGIGKFIEQPFKSYSSGMKLRLAFAVYTMVRPEILIIDEALAVGDEGFQRKCYRRLEALREEGTTLLFVSHSPAAVIQLCDRVLWFETGRLIADGAPKPVMDAYHRFTYLSPERREPYIESFRRSGVVPVGLTASSADDVEVAEEPPGMDPTLVPQSRDSYPCRGCEIRNFRIIDQAGRETNVLKRNQRVKFVFEVVFQESCYGVFFAMFIKSLNGTELGGMTEPPLSARMLEVRAGEVYQVEFSFQCLLTHGVYFINAGVEKMENDESVFAHRIVDAVLFRVLPQKESANTGMIDFQIRPQLKLVQPDA